MRISDWSSDVCSSDLLDQFFGQDQVSPLGIQNPKTLVSGNLKAQSQDEYIIGFEKTFDLWTFGIKGIYRKLRSGIEDGAMDRGMLNFAADNNQIGRAHV